MHHERTPGTPPLDPWVGDMPPLGSLGRRYDGGSGFSDAASSISSGGRSRAPSASTSIAAATDNSLARDPMGLSPPGSAFSTATPQSSRSPMSSSGEGIEVGDRESQSRFVAVTLRHANVRNLHWATISAAGGFDHSRPCNHILCIDASGNLVTSLNGLECFPWLISLDASQNDLRSLNAPRLPFTLTHINVSHNALPSLKVPWRL